ncbi:MAG: hypothetical protein AB8B72_12835 [Crocinitomicaceae bacterium]
MRITSLVILVLLVGCSKKNAKNSLEYYIEQNISLAQDELIACAASQSPYSSDLSYPTDVFFYPLEGATEFKYFECEKPKNSDDFSKYFEKVLPQAPVFGGYLSRFRNSEFEDERYGIVTYKVGETLHICDPIRLKTNAKPTEFNTGLFSVQEDSINPTFTWEDGIYKDNVIYFQVVSDTLGNLISGTYTLEKTFTFYDLSNVVLNITKGTPELEPNSRYNVTLMAVSEDNWVNLVAERTFYTN